MHNLPSRISLKKISCVKIVPMYHNRGDLNLECPVSGTGGTGRTAYKLVAHNMES